jgi:hypothetical protein
VREGELRGWVGVFNSEAGKGLRLTLRLGLRAWSHGDWQGWDFLGSIFDARHRCWGLEWFSMRSNRRSVSEAL